MNPADLRELAAALRTRSEESAREHVEIAKRLAGDALTGPERSALETLATVWDCVSRRHLQWATAVDVAAAELEEG